LFCPFSSHGFDPSGVEGRFRRPGFSGDVRVCPVCWLSRWHAKRTSNGDTKWGLFGRHSQKPMPEHWQMPFVEWHGPLESNLVWTAIDLAEIAAERVIDRTPTAPRGLIICGAAGSGKDHLVLQLLKARHLPALYLDTSSEAALVKFAYRHRDARVVLVSDNANSCDKR
jgi:hypothetical protein